MEKPTVYEMAQHYHPRLWSEERIKALYENRKLTEEEYKSLINKQ